jgi:hypothetical protein
MTVTDGRARGFMTKQFSVSPSSKLASRLVVMATALATAGLVGGPLGCTGAGDDTGGGGAGDGSDLVGEANDGESGGGGEGGQTAVPGGNAGEDGEGGEGVANGGASQSGGVGGDATPPDNQGGGPAGGNGGAHVGGRGGNAAGGTAGTGGARPPAACAHSFCDGFENGTTIPGHYSRNLSAGNTVVVDASKAHSGTQALHIQAKSADAFLSLRLNSFISKTPRVSVYLRMMVWLTNPPGGTGHWDMMGISGTVGPADDRLLSAVTFGGFGDRAKLLYVGTPRSGPLVDCSKSSGLQPIPPARWACVELKADAGSTPNYSVKVNGSEIPGFSFSANNAGSNCVGGVGGTWFVPDASVARIGWRHVHAQDRPIEAWIDDVVVDTKPIGCPK